MKQRISTILRSTETKLGKKPHKILRERDRRQTERERQREGEGEREGGRERGRERTRERTLKKPEPPPKKPIQPREKRRESHHNPGQMRPDWPRNPPTKAWEKEKRCQLRANHRLHDGVKKCTTNLTHSHRNTGEETARNRGKPRRFHAKRQVNLREIWWRGRWSG